MQKAIADIQAEVIVVDNNSTDGSVIYLQSKFSFVQFIINKENVGFGKANNQGVRIAKGDYILFLNPDTLLPEDCFHQCIRFMQQHADAGALGIKMLDGSGNFSPESKRAFPSPLISFFKLTGLASLFPRNKFFSRYHLGHLNKNENHKVDILSGAFMLVRKKVIDDIGAFDELFFMYGEDVDLSYRIQKAGWKNYYFAGSSIIHFKGESTKKGSLNYVRMFYQAMSVFVKKNYGGGKVTTFNIFIQFAIGLRAVISAVASFMKWIGLLLVDAITNLFRRILLRTKMISSINENKDCQRTLIVASPKAFIEIQQIMQAAGKKDRILGRITPNEYLENSIGQLQQFDFLLESIPAEEVIFCIDDLFSMKEAIIVMQQKRKIHYKFHYYQTKSIVGSNNKETGGETLLPEIASPKKLSTV